MAARPAFAALRTAWQRMAERERLGVAAAAAVVGVFLLWIVALGPALSTMREAPAQRQALQLEFLHMQQLAGESRELRALPPLPTAQSAAALKAATDRLGDKAHIAQQGDRSVFTFSKLQPEDLRGWLAEARSGARARPVDAQITRGAEGLAGSITVTLAGTS